MAFGNAGLNKRILHVDDDPLILDIVQATFRNDEALSVTSLNNAEDALAFIHNLKPDLIIEPPRLYRRLFSSSQATLSSMFIFA